VYVCTSCDAEYETAPSRACEECGCLEYQQLIGDQDLFDADELGLDPETDPERYRNG